MIGSFLSPLSPLIRSTLGASVPVPAPVAAPPSTPLPAPQPPDPLIASVLVLNPLAMPGLGADPTMVALSSQRGPALQGIVSAANTGGLRVFDAVGLSSAGIDPAGWEQSLATPHLTVECKLKPEAVSGAWTQTSGNSLYPVALLRGTDRQAEVIWMLALASVIAGSPQRRRVFPVFMVRVGADVESGGVVHKVKRLHCAAGPEIGSEPSQLRHLAGQISFVDGQARAACWWDGQAGDVFAQPATPMAWPAWAVVAGVYGSFIGGLQYVYSGLETSATLRVGGAPSLISALPTVAGAQLAYPLRNVVAAASDLRVTQGATPRYTVGATTASDIPASSRITPWPNY